jgi:hypothetical protein
MPQLKWRCLRMTDQGPQQEDRRRAHSLLGPNRGSDHATQTNGARNTHGPSAIRPKDGHRPAISSATGDHELIHHRHVITPSPSGHPDHAPAVATVCRPDSQPGSTDPLAITLSAWLGRFSSYFGPPGTKARRVIATTPSARRLHCRRRREPVAYQVVEPEVLEEILWRARWNGPSRPARSLTP